MAKLFRNDRSSLPSEISLVEGNSLAIKVVGLGSNKKHLILKSNAPAFLSVQADRPDDARLEQSVKLTVTAKDLRQEKVVEVIAYTNDGRNTNVDSGTPKIRVKIFPRVELPPQDTELGILTRMLIIETAGPEHRMYAGPTEARESMQWIVRLLQNRIDAGAHHFSLKPREAAKLSIKTMTEVVKVPGQVEAFSLYPNLPEKKKALLKRTLELANDATQSRFRAYRGLVEDAISVAGSAPIADPCPTKLYGWKTQGAPSPGPSFRYFRSLGGQDFYTLTPEFRADVLKIK
ncbi:hypothetical protein RAS12_29300 [Achromobacter seleniivolatilans]|uniref:Uncharacterized protein n=1 Tax=Achromobacter seleniivolatilans TaxID=3047478 RepID=A0ABY9M485_9BURK|nr:hypothetical protein [Achromobacter sp. R39]WMD20642.1 hypothetical protein RAS12_29300 [Achromobacter sp. R39]